MVCCVSRCGLLLAVTSLFSQGYGFTTKLPMRSAHTYGRGGKQRPSSANPRARWPAGAGIAGVCNAHGQPDQPDRVLSVLNLESISESAVELTASSYSSLGVLFADDGFAAAVDYSKEIPSNWATRRQRRSARRAGSGIGVQLML